MPQMALRGDAGETRHAFGHRKGGWRRRICVGIDAAEVALWGMAVDGEGFAPVRRPGFAVNRPGQGLPGGERTSDPGDARPIADRVRMCDPHPILPDGDTLVALRLTVGRMREPIRDLAASPMPPGPCMDGPGWARAR